MRQMANLGRAYAAPQGRGKKSRKGLWIFLGIIVAVAVILCIVFALNHKTISLALGKGSFSLNSPQQIEKSMGDSGNFKDVKSSAGTVTGVSNDGAVSYKVTQKGGGETVDADIDLSKLDTGSIDKSAILKGNVSAISQAKTQADKYLEPIVGKSQLPGIEAYMAAEVLKQGKANPDDIDISHKFGDVTLKMTGDLSSDKATLQLSK